MFIEQAILSADKEDKYKIKTYNIVDISEKEQWYGSLALDAIILSLAIYFIIIKRW